MFGKKKEITQKFIEENNEEIIKDLNPNGPKNEKIKNSQNVDNNFIFYGGDQKFTKQLEIYAKLKDTKNANEILNIKNKKLVLIIVDSNSPMKILSYKICEAFSQFPEYQNLDGLSAINLTKMEEDKKLPLEGKIGDVLRNGDIIYLDLISNEIWIKTNINMSNTINKNLKLNISMDIKVKTESTFKNLRYILLKTCINNFLNKFKKSEYNFHYIVSEFNIFTSEHGNIEENKLKRFDDMKIKQLFTFKNNMKIQIKFYPIEFLLFQKLKAIPRPKEKNKKKKSWDKFKVLRFKDLLNKYKYIGEKEYIFNYVKNLFKERDFLSKCYIYSLNDDIYSSVTDEFYDENKFDEKDISNLKINNEVEPVGGNITFDDSDLKKTKTIFQTSLIFNTSGLKSRLSSSYSNSFIEDKENKKTLIVVPPNNINEGDDRLTLSNKRYSGKNLDFNDNEIEDNEIDDNENNIISRRTKRKGSLYDKINPRKKKYALDFEIIEKSDFLENNGELIINNDLNSKKRMIAKNNLCNDFKDYFNKDNFTDFISGLNLMYIQKGSLERCKEPICRGIKIIEKKNKSTIKKKRKKKKFNNSVSYYTQVYPVKRINFEIGIFSLFIIGILIFLSYLITVTYY